MGENKYKKGAIYKVSDVAYSKCYIGSTCERLSARLARHKTSYTHYLKGKTNKNRCFELFDEFGIENCKIELIEYYPCDTKEELRKRGFHIRNMDCVNKYIAGRTKHEHYIDNKEHYNNQSRNDYYENREKYLELGRTYYINNREMRNTKSKEYHEKNKEKLNKKKSEIIMCQCGTNTTYSHKARHYKSKQHQNWLKQQEPEEETEPVEQSN